MTLAALILVGVVLVGGTLLAALLLQRRAERLGSGAAHGGRIDDVREPDEAEERLRRGLRSRLSHELRTPLNSIITLSQLLMEDDRSALSAEQRRYLEVIRRNGQNLLSLVDDIAGGSRSLPDGADTDQGSPDQAGTLAAEIPDSSTQATTGGRRGSASVLLIEDDALERQRIGSFIEAAGYEVTRAASGEEGLGLLRSRPFEVVVLDLIMPDMTGLDVLRAARTEERLAEVRFIVLSAMYMTKNERQVLGPRVADVVRKGEAMPRELTLALQRAIKTPPHFDSHMHPGDGGRRL